MSEKIPILSRAEIAPVKTSSYRVSVQDPLNAPAYIESIHRLPIQRKLSIGAIDDPLEAEADAMADKVISMPEQNFIQRKCSHCEEEEKLQRKPLASFIQRKETGSNVTASDIVYNQIQSTKGGGAAMAGGTKSFMENRFGADFSNVRIHTNNYASQMSHELNAQAFTVGSDIYFNQGKFEPESAGGKHLLAHELAHTLQQGANRHETINRKCEVKPALHYYQDTAGGKKVDYNEWLERLRKVTGNANKPIYDNALAAGKISEAFVLLVCKGQELLNVKADGQIGITTQKAFDTFATGGEKGIDYTRLFKDKKLEVGIAIGDEFKAEYNAIVSLLETAGKGLNNFSSTDAKDRKIIKFTKNFPVQGDKTAAPVAIDVIFELISSGSATPKATFSEFLSQKEIAIYSGHARYGTGPDFDPKASVKENFIIGVNSALHKAGKLKSGYDAHMNKILEGQANDLEAMSKAGKIDPNTYQVWFFNACETIDYLDEVRNGLVTDKAGHTKSRANLRFVGTNYSIYSDAIKLVDAILNMKTMDEIINILNANEKEIVKKQGKSPKKNYYFSD